MAEPLLCVLREYHPHRGIGFPEYRLLVSAYADDTLLYVRDPDINLSPVPRKVVRFGGHSGLSLNWGKISPVSSYTGNFAGATRFSTTWDDRPC